MDAIKIYDQEITTKQLNDIVDICGIEILDEKELLYAIAKTLAEINSNRSR